MNKQQRQVLFSSKNDNWETPDKLFEQIESLYGNFDLDAAASPSNAKCKDFYTEEDSGLDKDWGGKNVFVNPPYTKGSIAKWVRKASVESEKPNTRIVMLIPARTDTKWWHDFIMRCKNVRRIYFIRGRVKFKMEGNEQNSAPFPSCIIVYEKSILGISKESQTWEQ